MKNLVACFLLIAGTVSAQKVYQRSFTKMGSDFELTIVANDPKSANEYLAIGIAEIDRIEQLISSWKTTSETSLVNRMAGIRPVKVSKELLDLVARAIAISRLTDGAFDISYASVDPLWVFNGQTIVSPSPSEVAASVAKIGFQKIELDAASQTLYLPKKGMKIGFGAIGKGYAADCVKNLLQRNGIKAGIVNASGDLTAWGKQPSGEDWQVGLVNPKNNEKVFAWFPIDGRAVVTSGDYERFLLMDGKRYGHIINPKTGYPSQGVISCTVFAPKAELADALATALFVLGIENGLYFVNQLPEVEAIMINDEGAIFTSKNIQVDDTV